ncbi:MAG: aminomethyltransferase beta-barrel domain-containing protein, partial [bacterium]
NVNGEIIGTHQGAMFYTSVQHHVFEIFKKDPSSIRLFIISKDINSNTITVSDKIPGEENQADAKTVTLIDINQIQPWVSGGEYLARIRYRQTLQKCKLININNMWQIIFTENQPAVAIGQSAVIYDNNDCVGGGVIDKKTN